MFPTSFAYHRATSVSDAVTTLASNPDAKILAGGYSLIPAMKLRLAAPGLLVDLGGLDELRGVSIAGGQLSIGAMVTYNQLRDADGVAAAFPAIPESIYGLGDQQVREHGTIGGALAHNDPAADFPPVFLALGGSVEATGANGTRIIAGEDLFVDLWTTSLELDEVITSVTIPVPADGSISGYVKHQHPASGYAVAGVAVAITLSGGSVESASVVVTGGTSKPSHAAAAEAALVGTALDEAAIDAAVAVAADGLDINGDSYASAEFRSHLVGVVLRRAIGQARSRA
ncbi:MAG TPA: xanthine dehydrogenase family protein subunit M [Thermomicrobiales bacterium]|nr:xanthine dehydrogenase family protein subunit M [Thermomicrobiales bacterium]